VGRGERARGGGEAAARGGRRPGLQGQLVWPDAAIAGHGGRARGGGEAGEIEDLINPSLEGLPIALKSLIPRPQLGCRS